MKTFIRWLGLEGNSRAIYTLLAIGTAFGASALTVWENFIVTQNPALSASTYGDGYRSAAREAELLGRIGFLEETMRVLQANIAGLRFEAMTEEEKRAGEMNDPYNRNSPNYIGGSTGD
jgi:hypothetical protein